MKIELNIINKNITKENVIADIIRISQKNNKSNLSFSDYKKLGGVYSDSPIYRLFGSWNNALIESNLIINHINNYSDEELFENLETVWINLGRQPSRRDLTKEKGSKISYTPYVRRFGTWTNALIEFANHINYELEANEIINATTENRHRTGRDINLRLRFKVMKRDNFKCCKCGRSPATNPNVVLHVDHIKAWANGGETVLDNLQTLCQDCNLGKSDLE